ncbi:MAG: hypothetical protein Q7V63_03645 [Gammaproteobacteria bacterium]|nr:hypothetical protein [Gammaproteobacteria bacterium]
MQGLPKKTREHISKFLDPKYAAVNASYLMTNKGKVHLFGLMLDLIYLSSEGITGATRETVNDLCALSSVTKKMYQNFYSLWEWCQIYNDIHVGELCMMVRDDILDKPSRAFVLADSTYFMTVKAAVFSNDRKALARLSALPPSLTPPVITPFSGTGIGIPPAREVEGKGACL